MAGVKGAAGALGLLAVVLVLVLNLGAVMTWVMLSLGVVLGLFGLPILNVAARFRRWRKSHGW